MHTVNYVFHVRRLKNVLHSDDNQQMHLYRCVQSHNFILEQNVSVTPVTIISVSYTRGC